MKRRNSLLLSLLLRKNSKNVLKVKSLMIKKTIKKKTKKNLLKKEKNLIS